MCAACFRAVKPWLAHSSSPGRGIGGDTIVSTGGWQEFPVCSELDGRILSECCPKGTERGCPTRSSLDCQMSARNSTGFVIVGRAAAETAALRRGKSFLSGYGMRCFPLRRVINQRHNHVDAASLGLAIRDCKERQVCQLTYAPKTIGKLHTF